MRNKRKSKKGFTLMELSIVIALVAIVSVAAVGVCTLVSNITYDNTVKNEIIQESTLLKTQVASWVENDYQNAIENNVCDFLNNKFDTIKEDFDRFLSVDFLEIKNELDPAKYIIKCTVTLNSDYQFDENNELTFTVNPFVKESNNA